MNMKLVVVLVVSIWSVFVILPVQAVVSIGPQVIVTGTTIDILEPGPNIQTIIDDIDDESATKPYLIRLGPGEYSLGTGSLQLPSNVSLQGAGQNLTKITGSEVGGNGLVGLQGDDIELSDLTVINDDTIVPGASFRAIVIGANVINTPRFHIENVTAIAADASVSAGGIDTQGVNCDGGRLTNVTAIARDAATTNTGMDLGCLSGSVTASNIVATGSGTNSKGLVKGFPGSLTVRNSVLVGATNSIDRNNGALNVFTSELNGPVTELSSGIFDIICAYTYDGSGTPLVDGKYDSGGCQLPP